MRKLSGGPPDAATAAARALASGEVARLLDVRFTDERGRPWGGVEVEVTLPGEGPKQAKLGETGRLLRVSAAAGTVKIASPR